MFARKITQDLAYNVASLSVAQMAQITRIMAGAGLLITNVVTTPSQVVATYRGTQRQYDLAYVALVAMGGVDLKPLA